jgi:equilibrative nucleoside transporter 1/2/3
MIKCILCHNAIAGQDWCKAVKFASCIFSSIKTIYSLCFQPRRGSKLLPILCFVRVVFLPLFFFCNAQPRGDNAPVAFNEDAYYIVFMALFGISNGYLGSLCMMYGPG